jgi:arylsulfatase A-like enzyme
MVMRWPGRVPAGSVCDRLVQLHDLGHTFVDLAGAVKLPHRHGVSLQPLLENPRRTDWRDMIQCTWYGAHFPQSHFITTTPRHKYVFNAYDFDECYDLANDPDELRNIADDPGHAPIVADMQARTYEMMELHGNPFGDTAERPQMLTQRYLPRGKRLK